MAISRVHENAVVVTPDTLKHQIITRLNTLVNKNGKTFNFGKHGELPEVQESLVDSIETKGRQVLLNVIHEEDSNQVHQYNANEFYIEDLWKLYMACEPIYQSRFIDYGSIQED
jgi:hypothetical protein